MQHNVSKHQAVITDISKEEHNQIKDQQIWIRLDQRRNPSDDEEMSMFKTNTKILTN